MANFLKGFASSLSRTRGRLSDKLSRLILRHRLFDEEMLDELEELLIGSDVGVKATEEIINDIRHLAREKRLKQSDEVLSLLQDEITRILGETKIWQPPDVHPLVILVAGVNGTGKTTTIGKLAYIFKQDGKSVLLAGCDTFRTAANEQLDIWAERAGADIVKGIEGADPASVAFDAMNKAISKGYDVLIIDTAGRLHTKKNLMEELRKLSRVVSKRLPGAPQERWLVLDATIGQNGIRQAKMFDEAIDITGIILAKLDSSSKGGVVIAIKKELNIPVLFVGTGEKIENIAPFSADDFIDGIFSNG